MAISDFIKDVFERAGIPVAKFHTNIIYDADNITIAEYNIVLGQTDRDDIKEYIPDIVKDYTWDAVI